MRAELASEGQAASRKRVARLIQAAGITGVSRRRRFATTTRDRHARPAPNVVDCNFAASGRDPLWVVDITYIPDLIVQGWVMATYLSIEFVLLRWAKPQSAQLVALDRGQAIVAAALVPIGLSDPVADRLRRGLELARQLLGISS